MRDPRCPLHVIKGKLVEHAVSGLIGAAQESNLPSLGLPDLTGFEDSRAGPAEVAWVQEDPRVATVDAIVNVTST